jgi:hypothetical protein
MARWKELGTVPAPGDAELAVPVRRPQPRHRDPLPDPVPGHARAAPLDDTDALAARDGWRRRLDRPVAMRRRMSV